MTALKDSILDAWKRSNHETQTSLAKSLNVDTGYLSQVLAGTVKPSDERLDRFIKELQMDRLHTYLLVGRWPEEWRDLDFESFYDALHRHVNIGM